MEGVEGSFGTGAYQLLGGLSRSFKKLAHPTSHIAILNCSVQDGDTQFILTMCTTSKVRNIHLRFDYAGGAS
jgi:hypothetical protein